MKQEEIKSETEIPLTSDQWLREWVQPDNKVMVMVIMVIMVIW